MAEQTKRENPAILFIQIEGPETKTYRHYKSMSEAFDHLINLYEDTLAPEFKLDLTVSGFWEFVEGLPDLFVMLFDPATGAFEPHAKNWIKQKIYETFRDTERDWSTPVCNGDSNNSAGAAAADKSLFDTATTFSYTSDTPF